MLLLVAAALPVLLGPRPAPAGCTAVPGPSVNLRANVARATSSPWVDSNAWRFLRTPDVEFCIDAPGKQSALAAAEAFAYGVTAFIKTSAQGTEPFHQMLSFLRNLEVLDLPAMANIGVQDDGTAQAGELMNLLSRRNLLYRVVKSPDPGLSVNVSTIEAGDPGKQAYAIRQQVSDEKRLLRLYGSEVVLGRLTGDGTRVRLHLINYSQRPVTGLRVRLLGNHPEASVRIFGVPDPKLLDLTTDTEATEFTMALLNEYAVIDFSR
jgi:hypothetical protein